MYLLEGSNQYLKEIENSLKNNKNIYKYLHKIDKVQQISLASLKRSSLNVKI